MSGGPISVHVYSGVPEHLQHPCDLGEHSWDDNQQCGLCGKSQ